MSEEHPRLPVILSIVEYALKGTVINCGPMLTINNQGYSSVVLVNPRFDPTENALQYSYAYLSIVNDTKLHYKADELSLGDVLVFINHSPVTGRKLTDRFAVVTSISKTAITVLPDTLKNCMQYSKQNYKNSNMIKIELEHCRALEKMIKQRLKNAEQEVILCNSYLANLEEYMSGL